MLLLQVLDFERTLWGLAIIKVTQAIEIDIFLLVFVVSDGKKRQRPLGGGSTILVLLGLRGLPWLGLALAVATSTTSGQSI